MSLKVIKMEEAPDFLANLHPDLDIFVAGSPWPVSTSCALLSSSSPMLCSLLHQLTTCQGCTGRRTIILDEDKEVVRGLVTWIEQTALQNQDPMEDFGMLGLATQEEVLDLAKELQVKHLPDLPEVKLDIVDETEAHMVNLEPWDMVISEVHSIVEEDSATAQITTNLPIKELGTESKSSTIKKQKSVNKFSEITCKEDCAGKLKTTKSIQVVSADSKFRSRKTNEKGFTKFSETTCDQKSEMEILTPFVIKRESVPVEPQKSIQSSKLKRNKKKQLTSENNDSVFSSQECRQTLSAIQNNSDQRPIISPIKIKKEQVSKDKPFYTIASIKKEKEDIYEKTISMVQPLRVKKLDERKRRPDWVQVRSDAKKSMEPVKEGLGKENNGNVKKEIKEEHITRTLFNAKTMDLAFFSKANMKEKTVEELKRSLELELQVPVTVYDGPALKHHREAVQIPPKRHLPKHKKTLVKLEPLNDTKENVVLPGTQNMTQKQHGKKERIVIKIEKNLLSQQALLIESRPKTPHENNSSTKRMPVKGSPGRRKIFCGQCQGCRVVSDCGKCINCLDKPKFGGQSTRKQKCLNRRCRAKLPLNKSPEKVVKSLKFSQKIIKSENIPSTLVKHEKLNVENKSCSDCHMAILGGREPYEAHMMLWHDKYFSAKYKKFFRVNRSKVLTIKPAYFVKKDHQYAYRMVAKKGEDNTFASIGASQKVGQNIVIMNAEKKLEPQEELITFTSQNSKKKSLMDISFLEMQSKRIAIESVSDVQEMTDIQFSSNEGSPLPSR